MSLGEQAPGGATDVVVGVCVFSKWVELGVLPDRTSRCVAEWFYQEVICRFGCPAAVRTDQGREFMGEFDDMLAHFGV